MQRMMGNKDRWADELSIIEMDEPTNQVQCRQMGPSTEYNMDGWAD